MPFIIDANPRTAAGDFLAGAAHGFETGRQMAIADEELNRRRQAFATQQQQAKLDLDLGQQRFEQNAAAFQADQEAEDAGGKVDLMLFDDLAKDLDLPEADLGVMRENFGKAAPQVRNRALQALQIRRQARDEQEDAADLVSEATRAFTGGLFGDPAQPEAAQRFQTFTEGLQRGEIKPAEGRETLMKLGASHAEEAAQAKQRETAAVKIEAMLDQPPVPLSQTEQGQIRFIAEMVRNGTMDPDEGVRATLRFMADEGKPDQAPAQQRYNELLQEWSFMGPEAPMLAKAQVLHERGLTADVVNRGALGNPSDERFAFTQAVEALKDQVKTADDIINDLQKQWTDTRTSERPAIEESLKQAREQRDAIQKQLTDLRMSKAGPYAPSVGGTPAPTAQSEQPPAESPGGAMNQPKVSGDDLEWAKEAAGAFAAQYGRAPDLDNPRDVELLLQYQRPQASEPVTMDQVFDAARRQQQGPQ